MADNRRKNSFRPHNGLLILVGVCLFLMLISSLSDSVNSFIRSGVDTVLMPMQKGMNLAGSAVFDRLENLRELSRVRENNEALESELSMLREENTRLKLEAEELESLRELLDLRAQYPEYETVGAHIIGKNSGNWYQSFLIDKGTDDGLELNMNVIAQGGLVGIITAIGTNYATVSTIINDKQYVSAKDVRSGWNLMVSGDLTLYENSMLRLEDIRLDAEVEQGDTVVTSNISELYLPGILIGYVASVEDTPDRLARQGTLLPAVNFDRLDNVLVIVTTKEAGDGV